MALFNVRGGAGDITKPDLSAKPQGNLCLTMNSEWIEEAKIPSDRPRISSFDGIDLNIERNLMQDFADLADGKKKLPEIPNFGKTVELYKIANSFGKRNEDGARLIEADLEETTNLCNLADLNLRAADFYKSAFDLPINASVDADMRDTKVHVIYFGGPGLFLPGTTIYNNPVVADLLKALRDQSENLLKMAGVSRADTKKHVEDALKFNKKLSKVLKSTEEWADHPTMYNPMFLTEFEAKFGNFKIGNFLASLFAQKPEKVIIAEPRFLDHVEELVNEDNFDETKGWMIVEFTSGVAVYFPQDSREAVFPFSQVLSDQPELSSEAKQAYRLANGMFGEVVGVYYGWTYSGAEAKADVEDTIHKMTDIYEKRISEDGWLSEDIKERTIVELRTLILKIGYPGKVEKIYDRLQVTPESKGGSLYSNESATAVGLIKYNLEKLIEPVDRTVRLVSGNLVNACYDPQKNDIAFPAATLQKPFCDLKQSRGLNYGDIGVVVAHEISHAFGNNGTGFDESGDLRNWWTDEDFAEFKKCTQDEIDLFNGIGYGPATLNSEQIVSENIADQGDSTAAVEANKGESGNMKEVFENFTRVWANKQLPESIRARVSVDVHAPGPEGTNAQSQYQEEFYKTFDVKPEDGMWLDPEKRVVAW